MTAHEIPGHSSVTMSQPSSLPDMVDSATHSSFVETAHLHHGDYIVFSSKSLNVHRQTAIILHANDDIVYVQMAEIPQHKVAVAAADTGQLPVVIFPLLMRCAGNCMRYADITANAVVSVAQKRPALQNKFALDYDRVHDGNVRQVEVTRMSLGENQDVVFTPGSATMNVCWTAHDFIEHNVARQRVILRYNCSYAADDNDMLQPIQGDVLQIFFPRVKPVDPKCVFNHLYVTNMMSEPIHDGGYASNKVSWLVQHDGTGFSAETRQLLSLPEGSGSVDINIPAKYLRYSKLMPGDTVSCEDDPKIKGVVHHVIREHAIRGHSEYAVKYPNQDRFLVQERQYLACANPKSMFSAVHA